MKNMRGALKALRRVEVKLIRSRKFRFYLFRLRRRVDGAKSLHDHNP